MSHPVKQRKKVVRRQHKTPVPPNIDDLDGLIKMAQTGLTYSNIDTKMLWNILPQLIEINEMIGMKSLKETLFYQIIYYLQHLYKGSEYLHTVIIGPPGTGKCLGLDTNVLLYNGEIKQVQHVIEGDVLMGDDSLPRHVLSICRGKQQLLKVSFSNHKDEKEQGYYIVNKSHILSLTNDSRTYIDVPVSECEGYLNKGWYGYKTSVSFSYQEPPFDPYAYGYIVSMLSYNENIMTIDHPDILVYLQPFIESISSNLYRVNEDMVTYIRTHENRIPPMYKRNHTKVVERVFAGIRDAFGTCMVFDTVTHRDFIQDILYISNILGLTYSYHTNICSLAQEEGFARYTYMSTITYNEKECPSLYHTLSSKRRIVKQYLTITPYCEYGDYYGFELDGNHRFLLGNCMVTHNTTIAKLIGEMYKNMGILSIDGCFKIAKREDFVAEYLGQTAIKTKKLLESCHGGILFIDEAYALGSGNRENDSFSKEAIDTLNAFLSENADCFCCIVAGYEDEIKNCFFSINKGLERRFQWIHKIDEYSPKELAEMFFKIVERIGWFCDVKLKTMENIVLNHKEFFTFYGGDIEALVSKCKITHSKRIFSLENPIKHLITEQDIIDAIKMTKPNRLYSREEDMSYKRLYI